MTKYEIIDFLEWAKEQRQLEFPESRKVAMAERYIEEQEVASKNLVKADVIKSVCECSPKNDSWRMDNGVRTCMRCNKPDE